MKNGFCHLPSNWPTKFLGQLFRTGLRLEIVKFRCDPHILVKVQPSHPPQAHCSFHKLDCYHSKSLGDFPRSFSLHSPLDSDPDPSPAPLLSPVTRNCVTSVHLYLCEPVLSTLWHQNSFGQLDYAKAIYIKSGPSPTYVAESQWALSFAGWIKLCSIHWFRWLYGSVGSFPL